MFLAVIDAQGPDEQIFIESSSTQVVLNLRNPPTPPIEYWEIRVTPGNVLLNTVTIKGGPRVSAPDREVVEIVAAGVEVGSAVIEV